jgi:hypothetical protein
MGILRSWRIALGSALAAIEIVYLIGANGFLHSRFFDSVVNANPDKILVNTHFAYSIFPGWVNAEQIQVRGQDDSTQWLITVKNANISLSLIDLLFHNKFHVHSLDAEGGSFVLRARSLPEKYSVEDVAELPPIIGFNLDTLLKSRSDTEKRANDLSDLNNKSEPRQASGLSEVKIDQVHIPGFSQLWVNAYKFDGKIDVSGLFALELDHRLEIPSAHLEIISGALVRQGRSVAQNLNGLIDANIRNYEVDHEHALDIFKTLSGKIALRGSLDSFDPFAFMLESQDWFRLQSTKGTFFLDATAQEGRLTSVKSAMLEAEQLEASFSHFIVQGAAKVGFQIDHSGTGRFEFSLPTCRILAEKDRAPILDGSNLRIVVESPDLELGHLYKRVVARVTLPDSKIASFAFLNRWIPHSSNLSVEQGSGRVAADLTVSNYRQARTPPGKVSIAAEGLRVKNGSDTIAGKVMIFARVEQVYHESNGAKELKISDGELHVTGSLLNAPQSWTTDMKISQGSIRPDDFPVLRASIELHVPDLSPFLSEFGLQTGLGKFAQNLLLKGNFKGTTDLTLSERWIDLDQINLVSDSARMQGLMHLRGDVKQALAVVHYGILSAGIEINNDESHVSLAATDDWYKKKSTKYSKIDQQFKAATGLPPLKKTGTTN